MAYQVEPSPTDECGSFIGRERELEELQLLAPVTRELTLCGAGGVGKSRLAERVVSSLADDFADGAWFVDLAELRQPDLVASRIAAVMGISEEAGRPVLSTVADVLRSRRVLLALDTCEHLLTSCARVCDSLLASSPGLRIITTSRKPLRLAMETIWQVPPLSLPAIRGTSPHGSGDLAGVSDVTSHSDAVRLFADRAAQASPDFSLGAANAGAVAAICQRLDGLPLAIELAAARVRTFPADRIAADLDQRFRSLGAGGAAPSRHKIVRTAIDWSHDLLTPHERILLRRLSIFAGWTQDMAAQLCADAALPGDDIPDLLTSLMAQGLIVAEPQPPGRARYGMLDTIREYASLRLADSGEAGLMRERLRDYALREVEQLARIGMAQVRAPWSATVNTFRRFAADADNLRQVLSDCAAGKDAVTGLRVCAAMRPVWIVQGSYAEGTKWLTKLLSLPRANVPDDVRAGGLIGRAQLALATDTAAARRLALAGLELSRTAGADVWTAVAQNLLAESGLHAGRIKEAEFRAGEALRVARAAGDRWDEGYALGTSAAAAARRGDLETAQSRAESALAIMRDIDQQWGVARTLLGLGDLARLTGDAAAAQARYEEALSILRELGARPEIARCLAGLGRIALSQDDLGHARRYLAESIELSQSTGHRIGVIRALEAFADLVIQEGRAELALQLASAAAALREAAGQSPPRAGQAQRIADAAASVDPDAYKRAWETGSAMSSAEAVSLALHPPPAS